MTDAKPHPITPEALTRITQATATAAAAMNDFVTSLRRMNDALAANVALAAIRNRDTVPVWRWKREALEHADTPDA